MRAFRLNQMAKAVLRRQAEAEGQAMNPIADLEALTVKSSSRCNTNPPIHKIGCGCWVAEELRPIIEALKKRDEAVRVVAEELALCINPAARNSEDMQAWAARLREAIGD